MKYMTELSSQDLEHHLTDALVPGILATTKSNELQEFYREILGNTIYIFVFCCSIKLQNLNDLG